MCAGQTLEMHGNIHELVCPECGDVTDVSSAQLRTIRAKRALRCGHCGDADLRCRVMLYDDGEGVEEFWTTDATIFWIDLNLMMW